MLKNKLLPLIVTLLFFGIDLNAQKSEVELLFQQGDPTQILTIAQSPNGKILATAGIDACVHLRDLKTGIEYKKLRSHTGKIMHLRFSLDSKYLLSYADAEGTRELICWDLLSGQKIYAFVFDGRYSYLGIKLSPDGKYFVYSEAGSLAKREIKTGKLFFKESIGRNLIGYSFYFTPDGSKVISHAHGYGTEIAIIDASNGTLLRTIKPNDKIGYHNFIIPNKDNKHFLYLDKAYRTRLFWKKINLETGEILYSEIDSLSREEQRDLSRTSTIKEVDISPDKTKLSLRSSRTILIYDLETSTLLQECNLLVTKPKERDKHLKNLSITESTFDKTNKSLFIAFGYPEGTRTRVYDIAPTVIRHYDFQKDHVIREFSSLERSIERLAFDPSGKSLIIKDQENLNQWKFRDVGSLVYTKTEIGGSNHFYFSPKGDKMIIGKRSARPEYVDWNKHIIHEISSWKATFKSGKIHLGGNLIVNRNFDRMIDNDFRFYKFDEYDILTTEPIKNLKDSLPRSIQKFISEDGKKMILYSHDRSSNPKFLFYNLETSTMDTIVEIPIERPNKQLSNLARTNDERYLAIGFAYEELILFDCHTYKIVKRFCEHPRQCQKMIEEDKPDCVYSYIHDIKFSPDDKYLVSASSDRTVRVWEVATGEEIKVLKGHKDIVYEASFNPRKPLLATGSRDGQIIFWNTTTWERVATLVIANKDDYIVYTPKGYYMASKGALKYVAFKRGEKLFTFEQFDIKYNRPDIVMKRLGLASSIKIRMLKKAYDKRLEKIGFTEEMLGEDAHVPELEIKEADKIPFVTQQKQLELSFEAIDNKVLLDRILVYINDVPIYGLNGIDLRAKKINKLNQTLDLVLSEGLNRVTLSILNQQGGESLKETFEVEFNPIEKKKKNLYLLAVGVSAYQDTSRNLTFASKDAKDITTLFQKQKESYNEIIVHYLEDQNATKEKVLEALKELQKSSIDDEVILYFSSHGLLDEKLDYYLAMHEVDFENPKNGGLAYSDLEQAIVMIPARKRLVFIDACHSGEVEKTDVELVKNDLTESKGVSVTAKSGLFKVKPKMGLQNSFAYMRALFADVNKGTGATIISAAGGLEYALESEEWGNGVFTYAILEGIESKNVDENKNNLIQISELQNYIIKRVNQLTNGSQMPTTRSINRLNDFQIYRY